MSVNAKMTAIADAIRAKTGKSDLLTLDQMPTEIASISGGGGSDEDLVGALISNTLTEIDSDAASVVGYACRGMTKIKTVNLPECTSVGTYGFYGCTGLTDVNIPKCESIGSYSFYGCSYLTSVNAPLAETLSAQAFRNCARLVNVVFPSVETVRGTVFYGCSRLVTVDFHSLTNFNGDSVFAVCSELKALIIRNTESVVTLSGTNVFSSSTMGASGIGYVYVPSALVETYKSATHWSSYASKIRALEDYTIDGTITGELDESKI